MDEQAVLDVVAAVAEVEAGSVGLATNLDSLDWDSLANLGFMSEVDSRFGVTVSAEDLAKAATVGDLVALVRDATSDS